MLKVSRETTFTSLEAFGGGCEGRVVPTLEGKSLYFVILINSCDGVWLRVSVFKGFL